MKHRATFRQEERGESLPLALLALATGIILIGPLLAHLSTSLKTTAATQTTLQRQYSSDAGVEFALWKLVHDAAWRQTLLDQPGTVASLTLPSAPNGDTPTVEVVCVETETQAGGGGGEPECLEWALWAQSSTATNGLVIGGSGHTVNGGVHSNRDLKINGSGHTIYGTAEYVRNLTILGSGNRIVPGPAVQTTVQPFPITWDINEFNDPNQPGSWAARAQAEGKYYVHNGTWNVTGSGTVIPEGLHYCTGKVNFSGSGLRGYNVTVVSLSTIDVSGSGLDFTPYVPGLSFFSTRAASTNVVSISGSGNTGGTVFAPNGKISLTGSGGVITGAFLGNEIDINGSGATINLAEVELPGSGGGSSIVCGVYDIRSTSGSTVTTVRMRGCGDGDWQVLSWQVGSS